MLTKPQGLYFVSLVILLYVIGGVNPRLGVTRVVAVPLLDEPLLVAVDVAADGTQRHAELLSGLGCCSSRILLEEVIHLIEGHSRPGTTCHASFVQERPARCE